MTSRATGIQQAVLFGTSYIVIELADPSSGIGYLALNFMLQRRLHLSALDMAQFLAISQFAWYIKPIVGLLSDNVRLFGTRRRAYLLIAAVAAAASWFLLGTMLPSYYAVLVITIGLNAGLMVMSTVVGGALVETGQQDSATGRLSSNRSMAENLVPLIGGPVAGLLGTFVFGVAAGIVASLLFFLAVLLHCLMRENSDKQPSRQTWRQTVMQVKSCFCSRQMWMATGILCLLYFAPAFQTAFFYYQTETLNFSPQLIGSLVAFGAAGGLVAPFLYLYACKRLRLRLTLSVASILNLVGIFLFLAYRSRSTAIWISSANGLFDGLAILTVYDLLARSTPVSSEAFGYSLMFGVANVAAAVSDICGSWLWNQFHNFSLLVWLNAGTASMLVVAIPLLPRVLMDWRDDEVREFVESRHYPRPAFQ